MNNFAAIKSLHFYLKVNYYTVGLENEDGEEYLDLFDDFVQRHDTEEHQESLDQIWTWMKNLGKKHGAKEHFFRFEAYGGGDARALPPPAKFLETENQLRLYCMRFDEHNVILFNGGVKTASTAQACENVRSHFIQANRLSRQIYQAYRDGDIKVEQNRLVIANDFVISI